MLQLIAAADRNHGIGKNGALLARIPADLEYFRKMTAGKAVVMGRKTYLSLPRRPLPERDNFVLTSAPERFPEVRCFRSVGEFLSFAGSSEREIFVCGGASVYERLLPYCETAYLTEIDAAFEADAFLPPIGKLPEWEKTEEGAPIRSNGFTVRFCVYRNRAPAALGSRILL